MLCIVFYLNLKLKYIVKYIFLFVYPQVPVDIKKLCGYPHNGYLTDMGTGTGQIFIQWVGYEGATTYTLPAPLTSLVGTRCL